MTLLQLLLKTRSRSKPSEPTHSTDGFTMIELLVGAIVAFLIIGPLLGFVVNILNDDSREQVKTTTDYELQAAVDFISEDLSQAYYIYNPDQIEEIEGQTSWRWRTYFSVLETTQVAEFCSSDWQ